MGEFPELQVFRDVFNFGRAVRDAVPFPQFLIA